MAVRRADLPPEHAVVDRGVKQQKREDEKAFSPEHECQTRFRLRWFVDGEDEGNDVRPERDRQRAEGRDENYDDHGEGEVIAAVADAEREHGDAKRADHREDEQIRTLEPAAQHTKILGQRIGEHHNEKYEQADRQIRHEAIGALAQLAFAFLDQPAGAEKRIPNTQYEAAENREQAEPAGLAAR